MATAYGYSIARIEGWLDADRHARYQRAVFAQDHDIRGAARLRGQHNSLAAGNRCIEEAGISDGDCFRRLIELESSNKALGYLDGPVLDLRVRAGDKGLRCEEPADDEKASRTTQHSLPRYHRNVSDLQSQPSMGDMVPAGIPGAGPHY